MAFTNRRAEVGGQLVELGSSVFEQVEKGLRESPNAVAIVSMHQPKTHLGELIEHGTPDFRHSRGRAPATCLQWTYRQLHQAAMHLVSGLTAHGIHPGMRIATFIPNRVEYHIILWACQVLRLTLCSLDFGAVNVLRREELSRYLKDLHPEIIVVPDATAAAAIDEFSLANRSVDTFMVKIILDQDSTDLSLGGWHSMSHISMEKLEVPSNEEKLLQAARHDDPNRIALIVFTSGTSSGRPKGCPRHVTSLVYFIQNMLSLWPLDSSTVSLNSSANFRMIAPTVCLSTWSAGGTVVVTDPTAGTKGTIAAIQNHGANWMILVPALLHALVADPDFSQLDVSAVKTTFIGADVVTRDIFCKLCRAFPYAYHLVAHGMSEGQSMIVWPWNSIAQEDLPFYGEICPLGTVSPGTALRIRDPSTGETLQRNQLGELCVLSPGTIKNYLGNIHSDMFFLDSKNNQWFCTGDLALINNDDVIYIVGRLKDVVKRAGVSVTPAGLESCIQRFTSSQVAVIAYPHPTLGQEPLVVLDHLHGKTIKEIEEHVIGVFNNDYALGPVLTLAELGLSEFPLNTTGKIMKSDLLKCVDGYLGKQHTAAS